MQQTLILIALKNTLNARTFSLAVAGEGIYSALLNLAFALIDSSKLCEQGIFEKNISKSQALSLQPSLKSNYKDFWQIAEQEDGDFTLTLLAEDAAPAQRATYQTARTNLLFELFNQGALRGNDTAARQLLMDTFSYLPNRLLSSEGSFLSESEQQIGGIDKFPSLLSWRAKELLADGNRIVPSAFIRNGVHVGKGNIFMFHAAVNLAAYIGDDNLIDSHASIGSAAQIGNKNKIGSFVSLEGVLSPANAQGVSIGSENFLGSFARIGTGITLGNKNFIGSGVNLSLGTKIKDCREESASKGAYLTPRDLLPEFDELAIMPNNAKRELNGVETMPGEYLLLKSSPDFMARFEGDSRVKAKR